MINLTVDNRVIKIKNTYDEITVDEYDKILNLMMSGEGEIWIRREILKVLSELNDEDLDGMALGTFEEVTSYILIDDINQYPKTDIWRGRRIKKLSVKVYNKIENILSSDIDNKTSMVLLALYSDEYDNDLYNEIKSEKISEFIHIITNLKNDNK
jgi:hypothetical protein